MRPRVATALLVATALGCSPAAVDTPPWPPAPVQAYAPLSVLDVVVAVEPRGGGSPAISAVVVTQGTAATARLAWRLKRGGEVVAEAATDFAPSGTTSTRFAVWREGGWPAGAYRLELELDGHPAAARDVTVGSGS